ncbi:Cysteine desulfurase NifS [Defluviimonas aquaemixtae]|uniref:Cysteine desulfurase n=1 Tax=Albidovulum aquaemixtae TaxID=1542388 RepID=A0A2R8B5S6_9RHOB|nr:aminotransferase class V-fold PLP-dependent enzyme [Defluviimonas aquaemixtae]SPH17944.1 Cysteine desulfurase NifS [Defluviimonas aquaemixtae]
MTERVYLDWNATAPLRPEARAAVVAAMDAVGNPSSVHAEGRAARAIVERARDQVAALLGCRPGEVVFTSGATEAAGMLEMVPEGHDVYVQDTAHDCLMAHVRMGGAAEGGHTLAWGLANGETGVIAEPPGKAEDGYPFGARRADWLLLDVAQAAGRIPFAFSWSGADLAIVSAHKLGGPKGVGALIVRDGLDIAPLQTGGGQEKGRRSGTENVAGIAGFGAAAEAALRDLDAGVWAGVAELRDGLEARIAAAAPETIFVGRGAPRLPNTSCLLTRGWKGETQVMQMDLAGFAVSAGSACSSGKVRTSRVLSAMGYDDAAAGSAIRVSLGPTTRQEEIDGFASAWIEAEARFRARAA